MSESVDNGNNMPFLFKFDCLSCLPTSMSGVFPDNVLVFVIVMN